MTVTVDQIVARKSGRRWGRWLWAVLIVAVLGGGWYWQSRSAATAVPAYATVKAAMGDITVTVTAVGTVVPVQTVDVTAQVAGTLVAVPVEANQSVKKGEALAIIDTSSLQATVARDQAALAAQEAALSQAKATRYEAKTALDRAQKMADRGIATLEALTAADAAAKRAEAGIAAAEAQKDVAEADLQLAQLNLARACICAPIDGVVLSANATLGQTVTAAGNALFVLAADLKEMELNLDVDESDVGKVKIGDAASFTVEAYQDRSFPAKVTRIAFASQKVNDVVTYSTTLSLDNTEGLLRPGMTAAADITVEEAKSVLTVPNAAFRYAPPVAATRQRSSGLLGMLISRPPSNAPISASATEGGTRSIWVLRAGTPVEVKVKTGVTDGSLTQILSGDLAEGDAVITGAKAGK
jgi:HlyD family secretion protein